MAGRAKRRSGESDGEEREFGYSRPDANGENRRGLEFYYLLTTMEVRVYIIDVCMTPFQLIQSHTCILFATQSQTQLHPGQVREKCGVDTLKLEFFPTDGTLTEHFRRKGTWSSPPGPPRIRASMWLNADDQRNLN